MKISNSTPRKWICDEQIPTPQTKDGCAPAILATQGCASLANFFDTAHYPRMGVIEIGHIMKKVIPFNPHTDGTCRTIKAQYNNSTLANFVRQDGFGATGVIEYETD